MTDPLKPSDMPEFKSIKGVPTKMVAIRVVQSLILAKGDVSKWDLIIETLVNMLRADIVGQADIIPEKAEDIGVWNEQAATIPWEIVVGATHLKTGVKVSIVQDAIDRLIAHYKQPETVGDDEVREAVDIISRFKFNFPMHEQKQIETLIRAATAAKSYDDDYVLTAAYMKGVRDNKKSCDKLVQAAKAVLDNMAVGAMAYIGKNRVDNLAKALAEHRATEGKI